MSDNDKTITNKKLSLSIIFFSTLGIKNERFINSILLKLGDYSITEYEEIKTLKIYKEHNNTKYPHHFFSLSLNSSLKKYNEQFHPLKSHRNNFLCFLINSNYSSYKSFINKCYRYFPQAHFLYITYSLKFHAQQKNPNERYFEYISVDTPEFFYTLLDKHIRHIETCLHKKTLSSNHHERKEKKQGDKSVKYFLGLNDVSKEIADFLKKNVMIENEKVAQHIINYYQGKDKSNNDKNTTLTQTNKVDYKSAQKRVYDAINAMSAVGLISKTEERKGSIIYNYTKSEEEELKETVQVKRLELKNKCKELSFYKKYIQLNQENFFRNSIDDKLKFRPFYLFQGKSNSDFIIKRNDNNNSVVILSNEPVKIINYQEFIDDIIQNVHKDITHSYISPKLFRFIHDNQLLDKDEITITQVTDSSECKYPEREDNDDYAHEMESVKSPRLFTFNLDNWKLNYKTNGNFSD